MSAPCHLRQKSQACRLVPTQVPTWDFASADNSGGYSHGVLLIASPR
jgi:hypothetical protein